VRYSANRFPVLKTLRLLLAACSIAALAACSDGSDNKIVEALLSGCADTSSCDPNPTLEIGGDRPSAVYIPSDYDPNTRYPLIVVLHGIGTNARMESFYLGVPQMVDDKQYIAVTPDGTFNSGGSRFWNATDICCAFTEEERAVDDLGYIRGLIEEAAATYSIDTSRVALFGHSNGGFMALRMACEASDLVTTVLSLAGSTWSDEAQCAPATYPVSVLALHGTADTTVPYAGAASGSFFLPSAPVTAERFAVLAGCDPAATSDQTSIDMVVDLDGIDTDVLRYNDCIRGATVELWTINNGVHIPFFSMAGQAAMADWLIQHPR
jgi:polyhydroxybutyrate depolymerase